MEREDKSSVTAALVETKRKKLEELKKLREARSAVPLAVSTVEANGLLESSKPPMDFASIATPKASSHDTAQQAAITMPQSGLDAYLSDLLEHSASTPVAPRMQTLAVDRDLSMFSLDGTALAVVKNGLEVAVQTATASYAVEDILPVVELQLTEAEAARILATPSFSNFMSDATDLLERELGPLVASLPRRTLAAGSLAEFSEVCLGDGKTKDRAVTCIDWSPHNELLLIVSYSGSDRILDGANAGSASSSEGLVAVWNSAFPQRPQWIFSSCHPIACVRASLSNPYIIIGGGFDGSIVTWDMRSKKEPIATSHFSEKSHIQPIVSIMFPQDSTSGAFFTLSTDGKLCQHTESTVDDPTMSVNVTINKKASDKIMKVSYSTSAAFSPSNAASLFVGGIEGALYSCEFTGRTAGKPVHPVVAEASTRTAAHFGSISAISHHPSPDTPLLLTASYDFTVKLWHVETAEPKLLEVFETSTTFVTDVAWSPTHPGVFASADAEGFIVVYNILRDRLDPAVVLHASAGTTRLKWSADGKTIAVGDVAGNTMLISVQTDLVQPPSEVHAADIAKVFQLNDDLWKAFASAPLKLSP